uniref:Metalloendopeptidase n=1 Tax=Steinernema glaseri TaxID=37863 RepID=A0A1I7YYG4_9BILA
MLSKDLCVIFFCSLGLVANALDTLVGNLLPEEDEGKIADLEYVREKLNAFRSQEGQVLPTPPIWRDDDERNMTLPSWMDTSELSEDTEKVQFRSAKDPEGSQGKNITGDIILTPQQVDHLYARSKRQASRRPREMRWPTDREGFVPYYFDASIAEDVKRKIGEAIEFWEQNTCVRFKENGEGRPKLRFYKGAGCFSNVGKITTGKEQDLSIGKRCEHFGIIAHEIAHALGFYHEQSRYDRDQFLDLNLRNVERPMVANFRKESPATNDNYGLPYDYGSDMHYSDEGFAINKHIPVIMAKDHLHQHTMGQRIGPSFLDVLAMNTRYECHDRCSSPTAAVCFNGGYPNPNNCKECICPWSFEGDCLTRDQGLNGTSSCGVDLRAETHWATLEAKVGDGKVKERHDHCHWLIFAEEGKRVEIRIESIGGPFSHACFWNNVEFKMKADVRNSGYRMCGDGQEEEKVLVSETNLAVVSAYARTSQDFKISYRSLTI